MDRETQEHSDDENTPVPPRQPPAEPPTNGRPKKGQTVSLRILNEIIAKGLDFGNPNSCIRDFHHNHDKMLYRQSKTSHEKHENILHLLAGRSAPSGADKAQWKKYWTKDAIGHFLNWLLKRYPHFLNRFVGKASEGAEDYPFGRALNCSNRTFIQAVLSLESLESERLGQTNDQAPVQSGVRRKSTAHKEITVLSDPGPLPDMLRQQHKGQGYVQLAATKNLKLLKEVTEACIKHNVPVLDEEEGTPSPLHIVMKNVHQLGPDQSISDDDGEDSDGEDTVDGEEWEAQPTVFTNPGKLGSLSVYKTWKEKLPLEKQEKDVPLATGESNETASNPTDPVPRRKVSELLLDLMNDFQGNTAQIDTVHFFLNRFQRFLWYHVEYKRPLEKDALKVGVLETPYQTRIAELRNAWIDLANLLHDDNIQLKDEKDNQASEEEAIRYVIIHDRVADALRYHCFQHLDRQEILKSLYQPGDERHLDFDLAGLRGNSISKELLRGLSHNLQFECILLYVALPKFPPVDRNVGDQNRGLHSHDQYQIQRQTTRHPGILDLSEVFCWLRKQGVRKIIKVSVVDYGIPCHSDSIIERSLECFGVEVWDWKRVDLCTDVIANSTKEAREIYLYSSCNNAVLMGWASSDGLLDPVKFPELRKVYLYISMGQDGDRRGEYIKRFKDKVEKINVHVKVENDDGKVSHAADFQSTQIAEQSKIQWISQVWDFAQFLSKIPSMSNTKVPPIKIAIIDDGVDTSLGSLAKRIANGKSFCPYAGSATSRYMNAWYVPSGQHGTMMADLICQICPAVVCRLYVARLDERQSRSDSGRQITVKSAAEAVKWAINSQVDIISMSWSIEKTTENLREGNDLLTQLGEAATNNIIMFCSSSDQGILSSGEFYPHISTKCIIIGAATGDGYGCSWVDKKVNFLLPGKNIPFKWERPDEPPSSWSESGSSLATALAAGLGAILLYAYRAFNDAPGSTNTADLERQGRQNTPTNSSGESFDTRDMKTMGTMIDMFKNLVEDKKNENQYVGADRVFSRIFLRYVNGSDPNSTEPDSADAMESLAKEAVGSTSIPELPWNKKTRTGLWQLLKEIRKVPT